MTQFCIEEAVMERLHWSETLDKTRHAGPMLPELDEASAHEAALAEHERMMRELRGDA